MWVRGRYTGASFGVAGNSGSTHTMINVTPTYTAAAVVAGQRRLDARAPATSRIGKTAAQTR